MRLTVFVLFLALLLAITSLHAQEATPELTAPNPSALVPKGFRLVFGDEFEQDGFDQEKWDYRYVNRPYLAGFNSEEAIVQPGDGYLHLVTSYANDTFLTGMIRSVEEFQYGYFEARIRLQSLQGHHGALMHIPDLSLTVLDWAATTTKQLWLQDIAGSWIKMYATRYHSAQAFTAGEVWQSEINYRIQWFDDANAALSCTAT